MKKIISLLIAAGMLGSGTAAMAKSTCTSSCTGTNNCNVNGWKVVVGGFGKTGSGCLSHTELNKLLNCFGIICGTGNDCSGNVQTPQVPEPTAAPEATKEPTATDAPQATQEPAVTDAPQATQEPAATDAPEATEKPTTAPASAMEYEVFELVNKERESRGLSPLIWADDLADIARAHSQDMIDNNFFSHTGSDGSSPAQRILRAGITYRYTAENIAYGQQNAKAVMNAWMNSSGHRSNILSSNAKEIGVGAATAKNGTIYWTQEFVTRK